MSWVVSQKKANSSATNDDGVLLTFTSNDTPARTANHFVPWRVGMTQATIDDIAFTRKAALEAEDTAKTNAKVDPAFTALINGTVTPKAIAGDADLQPFMDAIAAANVAKGKLAVGAGTQQTLDTALADIKTKLAARPDLAPYLNALK